GIHPIWPSEYAITRLGNFSNTPDIRKSVKDMAAFMYVSVEPTAGGASFDVDGIFDDEPMCMHTTVPVSAHARKNGSQQPSASWIDGNPRNAGISVNATAWPPRAAFLWISSPASSESHSWMIGSGINRPSDPAHHSSNIQSL